MDHHPLRLTEQLAKPGPIPAHEFDAVGRVLGIEWPADYRSHMLSAGGGEGWVGEGYLALWGIGELVQANQTSVKAFEPRLVGIGTNGGGELFAYDTSRGAPALVMTPMVDLMAESWVEVGSFRDLLTRLAEDRLFESSDIRQR